MRAKAAPCLMKKWTPEQTPKTSQLLVLGLAQGGCLVTPEDPKDGRNAEQEIKFGWFWHETTLLVYYSTKVPQNPPHSNLFSVDLCLWEVKAPGTWELWLTMAIHVSHKKVLEMPCQLMTWHDMTIQLKYYIEIFEPLNASQVIRDLLWPMTHSDMGAPPHLSI